MTTKNINDYAKNQETFLHGFRLSFGHVHSLTIDPHNNNDVFEFLSWFGTDLPVDDYFLFGFYHGIVTHQEFHNMMFPADAGFNDDFDGTIDFGDEDEETERLVTEMLARRVKKNG